MAKEELNVFPKSFCSSEVNDKSRVKLRELSLHDSVNVQNTHGGMEKWVPGTVIRWLGPLTYLPGERWSPTALCSH